MKILSCLEFAIGLLVWCGVLWDGFATIILPRTVAPMRRTSGRFYRWTWLLWAALARRIRQPDLRVNFLAVFGPLSVVRLLVVWAVLIIVAFTLIYQALGQRFLSSAGSVRFDGLVYMSASTFLTLGLGDISCSDPIGRLFIVLEAGTGYTFLALMITYMPLLEQAYQQREVESLLIHSRAGSPPSAIKLLHRYSDTGHSEILRDNLRVTEKWIAETLQSHLAHPVLSFYRAQHLGQSWLISLTSVLDTCALLIAGGDGLLKAQARVTYHMGIRLLKDLTDALSLTVEPRRCVRLSKADLPALLAAVRASNFPLNLGPGAAMQLPRLVRRYDVYVVALSECLLIPLPSWIPAHRSRRKNDVSEELRPPTDLTVTPTINQGGQIHPTDGLVDNLPGEAEP
jgi:Ion channel